MNDEFENLLDNPKEDDDEFYKKYFKEYYFIKTHFIEYIFVVLLIWVAMFFILGTSEMIKFVKSTPLPIWGILLCVSIVVFDYYKGNSDE